MDTSDIRLVNIRSILNALRFSPGLTKRELSERSGLSFSTVSTTCNALLEAGILLQRRQPTVGAGRFPSQLSFQGDRLCAVCLSLQAADSLTLAVMSLNNQLLFEASCDTGGCADAREVLERAQRLFAGFRDGEGAAYTYLGVAIAVSGIYDEQQSLLMNCPFPLLNGSPIGTLAENAFGLPCHVNSASNYCAIDMRRTIVQADNFIYLHFAEELTAGIICQRQLVTGQHGHAPRIGHLRLGDPRRVCPIPDCGGHGCIETDLSLYGMVGDYNRSTSTAHLHQLWQQRTAAIHADAALYEEYLEEKGGSIGALLGVLVSLFDPAMIVIGGSCVELQKELSPIVEKKLSSLCPLACSEGLVIRWDDSSRSTLYQGMSQVVYEGWNPLCMTDPQPGKEKNSRD